LRGILERINRANEADLEAFQRDVDQIDANLAAEEQRSGNQDQNQAPEQDESPAQDAAQQE